MSNIIQIFLNSVIPVALIFLIGYLSGKNKKISKNEVTGLFKFIAHISAPAIIINIYQIDRNKKGPNEAKKLFVEEPS